MLKSRSVFYQAGVSEYVSHVTENSTNVRFYTWFRWLDKKKSVVTFTLDKVLLTQVRTKLEVMVNALLVLTERQAHFLDPCSLKVL